MTLKPFSFIKALQDKDIPALNNNIIRAYQTRLESIHKRENSGITPYTYQSAEHGEVTFSANGSPTVVRSFGFEDRQNKIIYVTAHAMHHEISAHVTDVTNTGITITCRPISGTGNFSAASTASIRVWYQVIGSNP